MIDRVFNEAAVSIEGLAEEAGVSRAALYAWRAGKRNPTDENLKALAAALRRRSARLDALAAEVEGLTED